MNQVFALVDCNNFYVSCERVFNRRLEEVGVVVLSNNDGCIISRSNEAKALGIGMGVPAFKVRSILENNNVEVFSSNYALYADMSDRVMQTLSMFTPEMEIYSIDEAFLNLAGIGDNLTDYGRQIKTTVEKWTGIPVSIGIGSTKTLAKAANKIAKRTDDANIVVDLTDSNDIDKVLESIKVEDVWGVGLKRAAKLRYAGVETALGLKNADTNRIKREFGVVGVRTVYELRGISCYRLAQNPPTKKTIMVSRSFGRAVDDIEELKEAVACYAARAGQELREEKTAANFMTLFVMTTHSRPYRRIFNSDTLGFPTATNYTPELINYSLNALERLYRSGTCYKKAGIILSGLVPENKIQLSLFDEFDRDKSRRLMQTVDYIKNMMPESNLRWAAEGLSQPWQVKFSRRSHRYTTRWDELPEVA